MRKAIVVAAAASLFASAAHAHALLRTASPPVGGSVHTVPTEVAITFSEGVEPRFSSIEVRDAAGTRVDQGDVRLAAGNALRLLVSLKKLTAGHYGVIWKAVSVDTHHTEGSFTFDVAPSTE